MLKAKVVQTLIMIVFMKTAKPVSICPSDISFKKNRIKIKTQQIKNANLNFQLRAIFSNSRI